MEDKEIRELEAEGAWALEKATPGRRTKPARAIVSVAFTRADFDLVSESAELAGMRTSAFIRTAALERASPNGYLMEVSTGTAGVFVAQARLPSITDVVARVSQEFEIEVLTAA